MTGSCEPATSSRAAQRRRRSLLSAERGAEAMLCLGSVCAMDELAQHRQSRSRCPSTPPLWREVLGARLRRLRKLRGLTLTELAAEAGVSPQYLSEVERGRKEPSSEMIAAISGALGLTLVQLTSHVADELQRTSFSSQYSSRHTHRLSTGETFYPAAPGGLEGSTQRYSTELSLVA